MPPAAAVAVRATAVAIAAVAAVVSVVALLLQLLLRRISSGVNYEATLYAVYNLPFSQ